MPETPYRLQILVPDDALRAAMKAVAHRENTSLQKLTLELWREKVSRYPDYAYLKSEGKRLPEPGQP